MKNLLISTLVFLLSAIGFAQSPVTGVSSGTGASASQTQGAAATGAAVAGNPVLVGGKDGSGNAEPILTDTGGRQVIQGPDATGTVTGSLTGNPLLIGAWNGTQLNRFVCAGSAATCGVFAGPNSVADGISAASTLGLPYNPGNGSADTGGLRVNPVQYNGTTLDTQRNASLANYPTSQTTTARNVIGAALSAPSPNWVINSQPAISTVASASIAAEALVRHVMDKVCFSAGAIAAPAATQLAINIRDGATGAGVILQSFVVTIPATAAQHVAPTCVGPLNLVGTTNTAMTAEWSALLTNEFEQISISGFNVN